VRFYSTSILYFEDFGFPLRPSSSFFLGVVYVARAGLQGYSHLVVAILRNDRQSGFAVEGRRGNLLGDVNAIAQA
jgi:hypothetical protein